MIFGWKKTHSRTRASGSESRSQRNPFATQRPTDGLIRFENVSLPPSIQSLSLEIPLGSWVILYGEDDFAKALFCDLCFSYIQPESGRVQPCLKGSDVSFIGRSNTTYGRTLVDHLSSGVRNNSREFMEYAALHVLSPRFHRHLDPNSPLEFAGGKRAAEVELDERDFLEIAEANVLLQQRRAAVIDTTSDFYQIALEQGFRHSEVFLNAGRTLIWIVNEANPLPEDAYYWAQDRFVSIEKNSLSFPSGARVGYIN